MDGEPPFVYSALGGDGPGYDVTETRTPCRCPYGQPGDRLWVREAWRASLAYELTPPRDIPPGKPIAYQADGAGRLPHFNAGKLRPGIHMPRWAGRITMEVTGVRMERLQDISEVDAISEGVRQMRDGSECWVGREGPRGLVTPWPTARDAFRDLWQSINGPDSWTANPWVWAIEFKRITP